MKIDRDDQEGALFSKFTTVIRATIKGSVLVAALQGALGGLIFWLLHARVLWGVVMGLLALLPAVGAALIRVPAATYLLAIRLGEIRSCAHSRFTASPDSSADCRCRNSH